jgi:hypothetical protein
LRRYAWLIKKLVPKDMHLRPKEVQQVNAERMVPAEMHLRPEEVHMA